MDERIFANGSDNMARYLTPVDPLIDPDRRAREIEGIRSQHLDRFDRDHITQPCKVGSFPCDVHILLAEIDALRTELGR